MRKTLRIPGNDGGKPDLKVVSREEVAPKPTPPTKIDLHDAHAMRRELGAVYRDMRAGRISTQDGTRLAFVIHQLMRIYEICESKIREEQIDKSFPLTGDALQTEVVQKLLRQLGE